MDILIVEDDPALLAQLEETLEFFAFATASASSAEAALAVIQDRGCPRILLTDINLGDGMNGLDLGSLLARRWPALTTILISGETMAMRDSPLGPRERFIRKPFRSAQLLGAIRELDALQAPQERLVTSLPPSRLTA